MNHSLCHLCHNLPATGNTVVVFLLPPSLHPFIPSPLHHFTTTITVNDNLPFLPPSSPPSDTRQELLQQIVDAERRLEALCVDEGWKQDPATSPHLHQPCQERMQRQQAEADARIQKNLDLIRKLMDDKKRLTEEVRI